MSIVKMKRLRIFGMASDCEELLRKLQHLGCVELRAPTQPSSDPGWQGFTAKSDGELANAQLRIGRVSHHAGAAEALFPYK